eukprot:CAMPEP_0197630614 /NCGR_PEP_ID=MMETSP1338-20131121/8039_1 /TAXON_ID=43686 ORGANISM="Pelagodinium beii, Strain RCC1491" /NCGR_SAMPLE_ID=MMETSP1338 /ASSEMBLY_ACC=CAM_ASM_000754 /LENGTH=51 /DNA_ID=CAMNT_0043201871 /DNA_START=101 /DNA_END=253 /DNA_ORIENTATION=+
MMSGRRAMATASASQMMAPGCDTQGKVNSSELNRRLNGLMTQASSKVLEAA